MNRTGNYKLESPIRMQSPQNIVQNSNIISVFKIKPLQVDRQLSGQRMSECRSPNEDEDDQSPMEDIVNIGLVGGRAVTRRTTMVGPEMTETARHAKQRQNHMMIDQDGVESGEDGDGGVDQQVSTREDPYQPNLAANYRGRGLSFTSRSVVQNEELPYNLASTAGGGKARRTSTLCPTTWQPEMYGGLGPQQLQDSREDSPIMQCAHA